MAEPGSESDAPAAESDPDPDELSVWEPVAELALDPDLNDACDWACCCGPRPGVLPLAAMLTVPCGPVPGGGMLRSRAATSTDRRAARRGLRGCETASEASDATALDPERAGVARSVTSSGVELAGETGLSQATEGAKPTSSAPWVLRVGRAAPAAVVVAASQEGAVTVAGAGVAVRSRERKREDTLTRIPGVSGSGMCAWTGTGPRLALVRPVTRGVAGDMTSELRRRAPAARGSVREPQLDTLDGPLGRGDVALMLPPTRDGGADARALVVDRLELDGGGVRGVVFLLRSTELALRACFEDAALSDGFPAALVPPATALGLVLLPALLATFRGLLVDAFCFGREEDELATGFTVRLPVAER